MGKITRPIPKGIVARKRLFRLLDGMRERPIIWVSGPAGSGKTTLISSYLDVRKLPCLWYQLDEDDTDLATFFYYLGLAEKRRRPGSKSLSLFSLQNFARAFSLSPGGTLRFCMGDFNFPLPLFWMIIRTCPKGPLFTK